MANQPSIKPHMPPTIGRYILKAQLGRGGMGTVYLGFDPRVERDVAVKVLPHEFLHDPMFLARFEREAKTIAQLDHPAVVPIHDYGKEGGQPYLVMRYMSGGTLSDRLKLAPLSMTEIIQILKRVGPVLDEAHKQGIYHRDIKPSNILFDKYGHAYLSDFGMVRLEKMSSELTGSHAAVGTPGYMSPEQIRGGEIDNRSDIYGLGVLIFETVTGKRPFIAETPAMVIVKQMSGPVPSIRDIRPELPAAYAKVVQQVMAKKPDDRPETAAAVVDLLVKATRTLEETKEKQQEEQATPAKTEGAAPTPDASDPETKSEPAQEKSPSPPPTQIMRAISDPPPVTPHPHTLSLAVHDLDTFSERDFADPHAEESLEIYCPNCTEIINIQGMHDGLECPHCRHKLRLEGHLCPYCLTYHEEKATLCVQCDSPLTRVCPECLTTNWSGAEECKSCHTSLDIFSILQLPTKHAPAERVRRQERQLNALRQVQEQQTEERMAAMHQALTEQNKDKRQSGLFLVVTFVGVVLVLIVLLLLLTNGI